MAPSPRQVGVVGAGIIGLAAADALLRQGISVTVYDIGRPGHGQSAGQSRIFRHAHDDPRLVDVAVRARAMWRDWEDDLDRPLIASDGAVALGPAVPAQLRLLASHPSIAARLIGPEELAERLPVLAAYDGPAMLDESAGSIDIRAVIDALVERVGDRLVHDHVLSVRQRGPQDVVVRTGSGRYHHDAVAVCAGMGTAALARSLGLALPIETAAGVRVTFAPREEVASLSAFIDSSGAFGEAGVYAAAYPDRRGFGVGLAATVPAAADGTLLAPDGLEQHVDRVIDYVRRALPGLDPEPLDHVHCWITRLPWGADGIGVWHADDVVLLAGHNLFKHAPVLGSGVAAAIVDGEVPELLRPQAMLGQGSGS